MPYLWRRSTEDIFSISCSSATVCNFLLCWKSCSISVCALSDSTCWAFSKSLSSSFFRSASFNTAARVLAFEWKDTPHQQKKTTTNPQLQAILFHKSLCNRHIWDHKSNTKMPAATLRKGFLSPSINYKLICSLNSFRSLYRQWEGRGKNKVKGDTF